MQPEFWHQKWADNDIAFHQPEGNPLLAQHWPALKLLPDARVFVPLCGKTRDMVWLNNQGLTVIGVELSELAVQQLFAELDRTPEISTSSDLTCYSSGGISIYVGNFFALTADMLGRIDAIYDRAALVALPEDIRARYTRHLRSICHDAPQLLLCFDYDQSLTPGPPFAIGSAEVRHQYGDYYQVTSLASEPVEGKLKGHVEASEDVWLLSALPD